MSQATKLSPTKPTTVDQPFENNLQQLLSGLAYIDLRIRWAVVRARAHGLDPEDEFRGLYISEDQIDNLLGYELGNTLWPNPNGQLTGLEEWPGALAQARAQWQVRNDLSHQAGTRLLLNRLINCFELKPEEVDILLVALAPEIDPRYERIFAYLQDDVTKKRPSVDLVLNLLTDSFKEKLRLRHLLVDESKLIDSRLIVRFSDGASREPTLLGQYLRPTARLVEHLLDFPSLDDKLVGLAELSFPADPPPWLPEQLIAGLESAIAGEMKAGDYPMFDFRGGYGVGKRAGAMHISQLLNKPLIDLDLAALAKSELELNEGLRLTLRDGRLLDAVLYLANWQTILDDDRPPDELFDQLQAYPGVVIVAGETAWQPAGSRRLRRILRISFANIEYDHRLRVWQHYLGEDRMELPELANQFLFAPGQIEDAAATAQDLARWRSEPVSAEDLFAASRAHSNQKLITLATKIVPRYDWNDIVLPKDTLAQLGEMVNTVRQKPTVYGEWGFDRKVALGKGLNALFAGESGTGKTMAADIMANELGLDLYKIDLSMMVSKYIGETEKNLNRVFNEAATSNAILFFDEADAIFGKRSEVKDSHDRYANIEISYLLQRMEAYDGVVILATNMRANLDDAFTRRLHFIIEFPFPEASDREFIWQVNFPEETPVQGDVDFKLLARRFRVAGGNIRNIIMAAAFLAAEDGEWVGMRQLLHASRREYQKIGRLIDESLFVLDQT